MLTFAALIVGSPNIRSGLFSSERFPGCHFLLPGHCLDFPRSYRLLLLHADLISISLHDHLGDVSYALALASRLGRPG